MKTKGKTKELKKARKVKERFNLEPVVDLMDSAIERLEKVKQELNKQ